MAAKAKSTSAGPQFHAKAKRKRKGVHAKTKSSKNKGSKNYRKLNRGQGH